MSEISSTSLHPCSGARFVLERIQNASGLRYQVRVYLPAGEKHEGVLYWDDNRTAILDSLPSNLWIHEAVLKLARVLHRDPKPKLIRWRDQ